MFLIFGLFLILVGVVMYIFGLLILRKNRLDLVPVRKEKLNFAILIPARDESAVIADLLESLEKQSVKVPNSDIFVIVETMEDSTVEVCREFQVQIVLRKDLSKQRKGYALDDAVKEILQRGKHYDLYFVFDADNLLDEKYLAEMLKTYRQGYQIATGYRNAKNGDANVVAAVSSLTFSMINAISNRQKIRRQANVVFSGTGCYVCGDLVEKWQGWPFHALTEDYEMSLYAALHGLSTFYNERAIFYDEQPTKYRATVDQRVRWIRGYFESRRDILPPMRKMPKKSKVKNYGSIMRERVGVTPLILILVGLVLVILSFMIRFVVNKSYLNILYLALGMFGGFYIVLWLVTLYIICREKLNLSLKTKIKAIFFNPLYLLTYIPCALRAILQKEVTWKKIPHGEK